MTTPASPERTKPMAIETAEDLVEQVVRARLGENFVIEKLGDGSFSDRLEAGASLIEADRAAVARAAKLELRDEIRAMASQERWTIPQSNMLCCVTEELRDKYGAAKEPG